LACCTTAVEERQRITLKPCDGSARQPSKGTQLPSTPSANSISTAKTRRRTKAADQGYAAA
jgi:hypothetical protein